MDIRKDSTPSPTPNASTPPATSTGTKDYVRFSDLDPLGHTNNNAIGEYFENARAALFMEVIAELAASRANIRARAHLHRLPA